MAAPAKATLASFLVNPTAKPKKQGEEKDRARAKFLARTSNVGAGGDDDCMELLLYEADAKKLVFSVGEKEEVNVKYNFGTEDKAVTSPMICKTSPIKVKNADTEGLGYHSELSKDMYDWKHTLNAALVKLSEELEVNNPIIATRREKTIEFLEEFERLYRAFIAAEPKAFAGLRTTTAEKLKTEYEKDKAAEITRLKDEHRFVPTRDPEVDAEAKKKLAEKYNAGVEKWCKDNEVTPEKLLKAVQRIVAVPWGYEYATLENGEEIKVFTIKMGSHSVWKAKGDGRDAMPDEINKVLDRDPNNLNAQRVRAAYEGGMTVSYIRVYTEDGKQLVSTSLLDRKVSMGDAILSKFRIYGYSKGINHGLTLVWKMSQMVDPAPKRERAIVNDADEYLAFKKQRLNPRTPEQNKVANAIITKGRADGSDAVDVVDFVGMKVMSQELCKTVLAELLARGDIVEVADKPGRYKVAEEVAKVIIQENQDAANNNKVAADGTNNSRATADGTNSNNKQ